MKFFIVLVLGYSIYSATESARSLYSKHECVIERDGIKSAILNHDTQADGGEEEERRCRKG